WHSFRHSYRAWLQESGAPFAVQQELMKHASITTTMNVYGKVMTDTKRLANSKVVQMVLGEPEPALEQPKMAVGA
ncbi:MAG TPA: tyrosine-type recombinase/integrase, partial [Bryobacteraceae bacterium]|nr:tyrosine-type recombinase/integrase [Bryobacteraceae bacterium]